MAEEETFECVFGYGDCSIRALMAKERKQSMMMMKTIPIDLGKDMPKEMAQGLNIFMQNSTPTKKGNMRVVNVWIPLGEIERLDELVKSKIYPSRNEAIRFAIHDLLRQEREV